MASTLNRALIIGAEGASYGTYAAPSRALEFIDGDTAFSSEPTIVQGQGIRAGALLDSGARRAVVKQDAPGSLGVEVLAKGQGLLWSYLLGGTPTSTLVAGSTYQQVFTMGDLVSFNTQEQWYYVAADGTFTAIPYSWLGCMVQDWELTMGAEIATLKATINARKKDTGQSAVAVTLPSTATQPLGRAALSIYTGTLTAATATALASATSDISSAVEQVVIKCNNNLNLDRPGSAGLKGKPVAQKRELTITATVEHRDSTWEDAHANQTAVSLLTDYAGLALSTGTERFQVAVADGRVAKVTKKVENGVPKLDLELVGTDATTPLQVVFRTSDTAL